MGTALRSALISIVVTTLVAAVAALALSWLLPSNITPGWAVVAVGVWAGITAGARVENKTTSWGQALVRGFVAALAAGVVSWLLGRG